MITISQSAKNVLQNLIKKENGKAAFLYLKGGGCNGFSYKFKILEEDKKPKKLDETINIGSNNLYLCNSSLMFLLSPSLTDTTLPTKSPLPRKIESVTLISVTFLFVNSVVSTVVVSC